MTNKEPTQEEISNHLSIAVTHLIKRIIFKNELREWIAIWVADGATSIPIDNILGKLEEGDE